MRIQTVAGMDAGCPPAPGRRGPAGGCFETNQGGKRRGKRLLLALGVLCAAAAGAPAAVLPAASPPASGAAELEPQLDSIVAALHEGDYAQARLLLDRAYQAAPSDPGALFFEAYARAWQGALNLRALAADPSFMYLLDALEANGEKRLAEDREEGRTSYYMGMASLMRARTRFSGEKRELLRASSDVRHGMRALERAVKLGYEVPDASFWTGAYRAMASALPAPLRALRALVGLPGGGREEATAELRLAAEQGRRFRIEASLFLAGALAEEHPSDYAQAVDLLRRSLPELASRGGLLPLFAGELLAGWGLTPQAVRLWEGVLERHAKQPGLYGASELARLRLDLARAREEELRWSEAIPHLEAILERADLGSPRLRQRAALILARCHARLGRQDAVEAVLGGFVGSDKIRRQMVALLEAPLPDPRPERELGELLDRWRDQGAAAVRPALEEFLRQHPTHTAARLHAGRASFELGLDAEAARHFRTVLEAGGKAETPAAALGWSHLYLGWLADRAGRRDEAQAEYRAVEQLREFDASQAGALYARVPYPSLPSREADVWAILRPAQPEKGEPASGRP